MGSTYKSVRVTRPEQSIFLATPAKERIKPGYAYSLAMTTAELARRGIPFEIAIMEDNCHVDDGRNSLVKDFLYETQCTDMIFLDADLRWEPKQLLRLISHDSNNIVAGAYPFKSYPIRFPVGKLLHNEPEAETKEGLLSVSYAPTGFMRIPRKALNKLIEMGQTKRGSSSRPTHRFFERRYTVNTYDGGDVTFCRKWIAAGGRVLIDSKLKLEHIGEWRWAGCFLDHLSKEKNMENHTLSSKDPVPEYKPDEKYNGTIDEAVQALQDGQQSIDDFRVIADAWGNKPWAATAEYGEMCWNLAMNLPKDSTILECGSGFTSILMAIAASKKGFRHIVLENNPVWHAKLENVLKGLKLKSELNLVQYNRATRWYDYKPEKVDMIIIDGPDRSLGADRTYPLKQKWSDGCAVILDDTKSVQCSGDWVPMVLGGRSAVIGRRKFIPETESKMSENPASTLEVSGISKIKEMA